MDDCSTDNTVEEIKKFICHNHLEECWKVFENQKNCGVISNFYRIIQKAEGDIIVFCDQDDIWERTYIQQIDKLYQSNPKVKAINVSFQYIDEEGEKISVSENPNTSNNNLIKEYIGGGIKIYSFSVSLEQKYFSGSNDVYSERSARGLY